MNNRDGEVSIHNTTLMVWEETVNEDEFRRAVWGPMIRFMRDRGWTIGYDRDIKKNYTCLNRTHRAGFKRELRCKMNVSGRCIELKIWSENWPSDNRNGHQYCFDIRQKMPYLTGKRCDLELHRIKSQLDARHGYKTEDDAPARRLTAIETIEGEYRKCCHTDKRLGRPRLSNPGRDEISADGANITHGQSVWFRKRDGRVYRGRAYYNLNNMWWIVTGRYERLSVPCFEIFTTQPTKLRRSIPLRDRRLRLESLINAHAANDNFERAMQLRRILFGDTHLYRIFSRKHGGGSYWGPCNSGYMGHQRAGRYTTDEAQRLIDSYPDELTAIPIGCAPQLEPARQQRSEVAA